VPLK
jgi:hypothetical protein